ncbi:hypothetical protein EIP91_002027 [Steccherinum ochraceum]|uniref:Uncharacterized protein n=1 Tax=Steccherinum ochraceum TaxID=92696 RepID=A0A4R0RF35_9APHY|nr:hypothetical protein EIP91_002027 [Steccherinum ochraceum]
MPFSVSSPPPNFFPCPVVSLEEAQVRSDIRHRFFPKRPSSIYTKPKPTLDFEFHLLDTLLIPRSMAALFDEIRYRGL